MLAKLSADILDRLDIFILEIEELQIPPPLWWEYVWCTSILTTFVGLSAAKKNSIKDMQKYLITLSVTGILPIVYCVIYYFSDVGAFIGADDLDDVADSGFVTWLVSTIYVNEPYKRWVSLAGHPFGHRF